MVAAKWLKMEQCVELWPEQHLPTTEEQWSDLVANIQSFEMLQREQAQADLREELI